MYGAYIGQGVSNVQIRFNPSAWSDEHCSS